MVLVLTLPDHLSAQIPYEELPRRIVDGLVAGRLHTQMVEVRAAFLRAFAVRFPVLLPAHQHVEDERRGITVFWTGFALAVEDLQFDRAPFLRQPSVDDAFLLANGIVVKPPGT